MHEDSNSKGQISLLLPNSLFFSAPTLRQIPGEVLDQIEEIHKDCRSIAFYLTSSLKKMFKVLREKDENRIDFLALAFSRFQQGILQSMAEKVTNSFKSKVLLIMKDRRELKAKRKRQRQLYLRAYQRVKTSLLFHQWAKMAKIQRSLRVFQKKRRGDIGKEIFIFLRENSDRKMLKKLSVHQEGISQFYADKIVEKAFQGFSIHLKISKLDKTLRSHYFPIVIREIIKHNKLSKIYKANRCQFLKANCFSSWKTEYQTKKAEVFHEKRLLSSAFLRWNAMIDYLASQNQIQKENNRIVTLFRDRCEDNKLSLIFSHWRQLSQKGKCWRRQNQILNRCAQAKFIQTLLRKHFEKLKAHRFFSKIRSDYYEVKLKRKALDSLKYSLIASAERQEKLLTFLQRRTLSKYFQRIKRFNRQQALKVLRFTQQRAFRAFSFTIAYQFFLNKKKAASYHSQNLLFKSLFALKKERTQRVKEQLCIVHINLAMPLRRWYRDYQIRNCIVRKRWLRTKAIIRQWRLLAILRQSREQLVRQFTAEQSGAKPQEAEIFEFDNIMATIAKIRKNFILQKSAKKIDIAQLSE